MYEYDFLRAIQEQIRIYKEFPLPVVICSKEWKVYWSNDLARQYYAHVTETEGLAHVIEEFDADSILREAEGNGNCTIREIFPMSSVNMSITPIFGEEKLVGAVLIFVRADNLIDSKTFYQSTHMTSVLSNSIRDVVSETFSILDLAALKSDFMNVSWMKAGFDAVAYNNYRILRIASNITEYAKYQSGISDMHFTPVNLSAMFRETNDTICGLAATMGISVLISVPDQDIYVNIDNEIFWSAFYNVLHNALYYTREGNKVRVALSRNKKAGKATITVADKGLGIPAWVLQDITRPYFVYAHGVAGHGIGLGLAVAKLIISAHGGSLEIHSREGTGTTVKIILPVGDTPLGVSLAQNVDQHRLRDRFSPVYTGLADAIISPHRSRGAR